LRKRAEKVDQRDTLRGNLVIRAMIPDSPFSMTIPPRFTDNSVRALEKEILFHGLCRYVGFPERAPERNKICEEVTAELRPLHPTWNFRSVRIWFLLHQGLFDGILSEEDGPGTAAAAAAMLPPIPSLAAPGDASGAGMGRQCPSAPSRVGSCDADSEYARALTESGFRTLMSDAAVGRALINAVLQATVPGFLGLVRLRLAFRGYWGPGPGTGRMAFIAEMVGDDCLSYIETEVRLFSRCDGWAVSRATSDFAGRESREGMAARGHNYAIQFLDCNCPHGEPGASARRRDDFSGDRGEMQLIQICLMRMNICFPVPAEVALGWMPIDWWYYVLKFSHLFTAQEIQRCHDLGMPDDVASGIGRLRRKPLTNEAEEESQNGGGRSGGHSEISEIRPSEAEQELQLKALMTGFLSGGLTDDGDGRAAIKPLRAGFVRSVWDRLQHEDKTEESYQAFTQFLRQGKLLID
jgi:hypothetical protein